MAGLSETEFRDAFRGTPVTRARYSGFLRNVAIAMGNSGSARFRPALERLATSEDAVVADAARWALERL
jgi:epoxyqueuosine reductase